MKDDTISRQAAIDIVQHECGEWKGLAKEIVKQFNGLPSAHPKADIRLFGEYMILPDIPTPDEKKKIADELLLKLLNGLQKDGCVEFVWHLDGEIKAVGVKMYVAMPEPYREEDDNA